MCFYFSWGKCPRMQLLGHMVIAYLVFLYVFLFSNWSIVDLHVVLVSGCTVKWFRYIHIYVYIWTYMCIYYTFSDSFSIVGYYKILNIVPCAVLWTLLLHGYLVFIRNCPTVFQNGCTILYSHHQCMKIDFLCIFASVWCYHEFLF